MIASVMTLRGWRHSLIALALVALLAAAVELTLGLSSLATHPSRPAIPALVDFSRLPLAFEPAAPRGPAPGSFRAHTPAGSLSFESGAVVLALAGGVVRQEFLGASASSTLAPAGALPGRVNYYRGADPARWQTGLPTYAGITYHDLYPGVDLHYAGTGGHLKGTYTIAPGSDPGQIRWRYTGAAAVQVAAAGALRVVGPAPPDQVAGATLFEEDAPVAWQEVAGRRVAVPARYAVAADGSAGFALGAYDQALPLTLDPTLTFATYYGGGAPEYAHGVALDAQGNVYVVGSTNSANFPTHNAEQGSPGSALDGFVIKFDPGGTPVYATYLGGGTDDWAWSVAVDAQGNASVVGQTASHDFPLRNAYQPQPGGNYDGFLARFDAAGALVYSTYLGGTGADIAYGVAVDSAGAAYIAGSTTSANFPTAAAYQAAYGGNEDGFVAKFSSDGARLIYSTYLGGSGDDTVGGNTLTAGHGIAVDAQGSAYLTGRTTSANFPTFRAIYPLGGDFANPEAYITKLSPDGRSLVYSTYLGSHNTAQGRDIALDPAGNVYVTGHAASGSFPLVHSVLRQCSNNDAFVSKLNAAGTALIYSGCLGYGYGYGIGADAAGNAYVAGITGWPQFPVANPLQPTLNGGLDAFVSALNPNGSALVYSTFLGGSQNEEADDLAADANGNVAVVGWTTSSDFPTVHPAQAANAGRQDAFVVKINPAPASTPLPSPTPCPIQFGDVPAGSPFYLFVRTLACRGVLSGYGDGTFRPGTPVTRAQVAKIVGAADALTPAPCCTQTFADVPTTHPFYGWIQTAANQGLVSGYACGGPGETCDGQHRPYFRPGANVTRGQLAKIVGNAAGFGEAAVDQTFEDVPPAQPFNVYVERIAARGIISGYACGTAPAGPCVPPGNRPYFLPDGPVTRGQVAKIVANTFFPGAVTPAGLR